VATVLQNYKIWTETDRVTLKQCTAVNVNK